MQAPTPARPDFLPVFPFFFAGLWLLVSLIVSRRGWRSFAMRYPAPTRPAGNAYNSPSSTFGVSGHYRNVVRVVFAGAGVYFYVTFMFRAFHPPFLVPWESVKCIERKKGFFGSSYALEIEDAAGKVQLHLPRRIEPDLSRYQKTV